MCHGPLSGLRGPACVYQCGQGAPECVRPALPEDSRALATLPSGHA